MIIPKNMLIILLTFLVGLVTCTERPIIGILAEEVSKKTYPDYTSFIAASYVKAVEQSGARVVPIFINQTTDYYRELLSSVNGVLFPGGGLYFTTVGGYADAGRIIVNYTKEANARGDIFPILGICLGFELLLYLDVESYDILDYCNSTDVPLPLKFKDTFHSSRLYYRAPRNIIQILSDLPVTYNHHMRCVTEEALKQKNLNKTWHVLSTSLDKNGKEFISSVETYQYPIAGIQFHPEKNAFEWNRTLHIPHFHKAVTSSRYFLDWLVDEARKNSHSFSDPEKEDASLIYNYDVTYKAGYYEQVYLFK